MKRKTKLVLWGICAFWSVVLLVLLIAQGPIATELEHVIQNRNVREGRTATVDPRLRFLGIDAASMDVKDNVWQEDIESSPALKILAQNPGPPPRHFYPYVVERLCEAGAKLVVLDIVLTGEKPEDPDFQRVIEKYQDRVVVGADWTRSDRQFASNVARITLPSDTVVPSALVEKCIGTVNYFPDDDGVIRTYIPERFLGKAEGLKSFNSLARISVLKTDPALSQPSGESPVYFRYVAPPGGIKVIGVYEIFDPGLWEHNFGSGASFKDKIVLVGPAATVLQDYHRTPFQHAMLGPELHLNVLNAVLTSSFLRTPAGRLDYLLIPLAGCIAGFLNIAIRQSLFRLILATLISLAFIGLTRVAYNNWDLYIVGMTPALCLFLSTVTSLSYEIVVERMEKARFRSTLELYVSKNVATEIMRDEESFKNALGGARKPVTILFSDIRGFTTMTEGVDEQELVVQLNQYFARMVDHGVLKHQGTLHKFIGDAIMAVWGDTVTAGPREDACRAVRTALEMRRELPELNEKWEQEGRPKFKIGIGVNHGTVVVGNIGSEQRREFTVIGDAVNLASRLEGATKEFHTDILIGEETFALVKDHFALRTAGRIVVKGKTKPITVYEPVAELSDSAPRFSKVEVEAFETAVAAYYASQFAEAIAGFDAFLQKYPADALATRFLESAKDFTEMPPEEGWDGVERLKNK